MRWLPQLVQQGGERLVGIMRRLDPYYRDAFDQWLRPPLQAATQALIRLQLKDEGLALAEERVREDEIEVTNRITDTMNRFLVKEYHNTGKIAERAGNTKTYGVVRATLVVNEDLPESLRVGVFREPRSYPAYVRFGGPGPRVVADVDDNGILSIGVKLMDVPGPKLIDDERYTQDFLGISSPTFTTPDIYENVKLQREVGRDTPAWYFLNPLDSPYLDMTMQGLYARAHANPLELTYHSCVPYLFGTGRAIKYAINPRMAHKSKVGRMTYDYLREAMAATLSQQGWIFDFLIQFQADPVTMPIENASVVWSQRVSPMIPVATLEIPPQTFDSPAQLAFARNLSFNPWHALAEHRPLGNQNRARKAIYLSTSNMRRSINGERHLEPTGDEVFDEESGLETGLVRRTAASKRASRRGAAKAERKGRYEKGAV